MKAGTKAKRIIRRGVDAAMYLLYLLLMGQYALRGAAHEWLGMAIGLLFLAHNALNLSWYRALGRGGRSAARTLQSIVNLPLALVMLLCMISGMLVSRHIFSLGGRLIELGRRVHLCATAWGFVLMSLHLGLHGSLLTRSIRRAGRRRALSSLAAALCVCGMILFVKSCSCKLIIRRNMIIPCPPSPTAPVPPPSAQPSPRRGIGRGGC